MATRLGIWFAKNSMQQNHDETVMPGMPETLGVGRRLLGRPRMPPRLMALMTESSQTHRVEGWRLIATRRNGGKKGLHFKSKEEHYAHWEMECSYDEGPRETGPAY